MQWETSLVEHSLVASAGTGTVVLNALYPASGWSGINIKRIVGTLQVQANVAGFLLDFSAGFSLKENGISPSLTDLDEPWLWWTGGHVPDQVSGQNKVARTIDIDTKSNRRFRESDSQFRFNIKNEAGSGDLVFSLAVRTLYALA